MSKPDAVVARRSTPSRPRACSAPTSMPARVARRGVLHGVAQQVVERQLRSDGRPIAGSRGPDRHLDRRGRGRGAELASEPAPRFAHVDARGRGGSERPIREKQQQVVDQLAMRSGAGRMRVQVALARSWLSQRGPALRRAGRRSRRCAAAARAGRATPNTRTPPAPCWRAPAPRPDRPSPRRGAQHDAQQRVRNSSASSSSFLCHGAECRGRFRASWRSSCAASACRAFSSVFGRTAGPFAPTAPPRDGTTSGNGWWIARDRHGQEAAGGGGVIRRRRIEVPGRPLCEQLPVHVGAQPVHQAASLLLAGRVAIPDKGLALDGDAAARASTAGRASPLRRFSMKSAPCVSPPSR